MRNQRGDINILGIFLTFVLVSVIMISLRGYADPQRIEGKHYEIIRTALEAASMETLVSADGTVYFDYLGAKRKTAEMLMLNFGREEAKINSWEITEFEDFNPEYATGYDEEGNPAGLVPSEIPTDLYIDSKRAVQRLIYPSLFVNVKIEYKNGRVVEFPVVQSVQELN